MLLNKELAASLLEAWTADQKNPLKRRGERTIPSINEFEIFLDTMFQVSLLKEEGSPAKVSVSWISKVDFSEFEVSRNRRHDLCLRFNEPIEFSASNLAKMSGVTNGDTSVLLAHGDGRYSYIWGICYFESITENIEEIPVGVECCRHFPPRSPTITTTGPGSLEVLRGKEIIGRLENGKFLTFHNTIIDYGIIRKYLLKIIGIDIDIGWVDYKNSQEADFSMTYLLGIKYLLHLLSKRKQAATVILVPDKEQSRKYYDTSWEINGSLELGMLLQHKAESISANNLKDILCGLKISRSLTNRIKNIADLSKMDGAVLLHQDLEVLAFGAKLKAKHWDGKIVNGPIPFFGASQLINFDRLGTRHNSALNFVGEVDGSVAFISSSDGPIRVVCKDFDKSQILYWSDCRETIVN